MFDLIYGRENPVRYWAHTIYSTVYDLRRGLIYLYYFHDFDRVVVLDLHAELAKGIHASAIPALFPPAPAARAFGQPLLAELERRRADVPHAAVAPELLQRYVGTYELTPASHVLVTRAGGTLLARESSSPPVALISQSPTQFAHVFSDGDAAIHQYTLTFLTDDTGQVTGVEVTDETGATVVARKIGAPAGAFGWRGSPPCSRSWRSRVAGMAGGAGRRGGIALRATIDDVTQSERRAERLRMAGMSDQQPWNGHVAMWRRP